MAVIMDVVRPRAIFITTSSSVEVTHQYLETRRDRPRSGLPRDARANRPGHHTIEVSATWYREPWLHLRTAHDADRVEGGGACVVGPPQQPDLAAVIEDPHLVPVARASTSRSVSTVVMRRAASSRWMTGEYGQEGSSWRTRTSWLRQRRVIRRGELTDVGQSAPPSA